LMAGGAEKSFTDSTVGDDVIDSLSADGLIAMALKPDDDDDGG